MSINQSPERKQETRILEVEDLSTAKIEQSRTADAASEIITNSNANQMLSASNKPEPDLASLRQSYLDREQAKKEIESTAKNKFEARPEDLSPLDKFVTMLARLLESIVDKLGLSFFSKSKNKVRLEEDLEIQFTQPQNKKKKTKEEEELEALSFTKR